LSYTRLSSFSGGSEPASDRETAPLAMRWSHCHDNGRSVNWFAQGAQSWCISHAQRF